MDIVPGTTFLYCDDVKHGTIRNGKYWLMLSAGAQPHSGVYVIKRVGRFKYADDTVLLCERVL